MARMGLCMILVAGFAGGLLNASAEEPALPPGLETQPGAPVSVTSGPALPSGLGEETKQEPGLPPGLEGQSETAPVLPPGLGEEPKPADGSSEQDETSPARRLPDWLHGYWETRAGIRTQQDPEQPSDASIAEMRLQLETKRSWERAIFEFRGDVYTDAIREDAEFDLRQLRLSFTPIKQIDIRIGRQPLTWGTGDLLFINDLFPKDWQSFFLGRDVEYLKAPSDAVRIGWFPGPVNVDVVYTPQFDPDRFIRGDRISYYNPLFGPSGKDRPVNAGVPDRWFTDDEKALRIYRKFGTYEYALYGYSGFWKSPAGQRLFPFEVTFPRLNVYGASARGPLGKGILSIEVGYYDSREDKSGGKIHVNNSEFRFLIGYEQELAKEFTGGIQYYVEHMMDYDAYRSTIFKFLASRDENRHVVTLRLTKLLMSQDLTLSLFTYYSPSDQDAYFRPHAEYKVNNHWTVSAGGNFFLGESNRTFFGQFENNSNVYAAARYSF